MATTDDTKSNTKNVTVTIDLYERDDSMTHRHEYAERIAAHLRDGDYKLPNSVRLEMVIHRASEGSPNGRIFGLVNLVMILGLVKSGWAKLWVKWTLKRHGIVVFERLEKCESHGLMGLKDIGGSNSGQKSLLGRLQEDMIRNIRIKSQHMLKNQKNPGQRPDVTCL